MTQLRNWRHNAGITLTVILLAAAEVWALNTQVLHDLHIDVFGLRPARDFSIQLDLIIVLPLALLILTQVWFRPTWSTGMLARLSGHLPRIGRSVAWMLAIWLGYLLLRALPLPQTASLVVFVVVEGAFVMLLIWRVIRLSRQIRPLRQEGYSLVTALMQSVPKAFGSLQLKLALRLVIAEFALLTYALAGWLLPRSRAGVRFSNHRRDDDTVFIGFALLICLEAVPVHFIVHDYSVWAAWVLTGLSAYTLMWIVGEMAARRYRPTLLTRDWLRVNHGLRGEVVIRLSDIEAVEASGEQEAQASVGSDGQLLFRLSEATTVFGLFGKETQARVIRIGVDEPELLVTHLRDHGVNVEAG